MGIMAWAVPGPLSGMIAKRLAGPRRGPPGLIIIGATGAVGAVLGGWRAIRLVHIGWLRGFFSLSTWLTAIVSAAILLAACRLSGSRTSRAAHAAVSAGIRPAELRPAS
jgi:uncharacterized membrane protein YeaQ/YmgE (transglycosylase-associated protein family)